MPNGIEGYKMIKVGFMGNYSKEWMGGVNYLSNLLYALSTLKEKEIEPIVFLGTKTDPSIIEKFKPYAQVIQDTLFDKKSIKSFLSRILEKFFKSYVLKEKILEKYNISVISHSRIATDSTKYKKINWIPDFQHIHFPELFSQKELMALNTDSLKFLALSDIVIVSSYDAYNDCKNFAPEFIDKVRVLQFVSQPSQKKGNFNGEDKKILENKFKFSGQYFYLPNQFWKHKNHMIVLGAVKLLKEKGIDILILFSGLMNDYRHPEYIMEIENFVKEFGLQENIKFLGLIDYDDVFYLMRNSLAVINPSLFEGWSSTVEECKSIGKNMILSDIPIHREQNPLNALYFNPHNPIELSELLNKVLNSACLPNNEFEETANNQLIMRTLDFATNYQNIILQSCQSR